MQNKTKNKNAIKGFIQHQISFFKKRKFGAGFTLIELMVVVAIIALLSSIVLVSLSSARNKAKEARVQTEIHNIKLALEEYNTQYGGYPNPNPGTATAYCIGSDQCAFPGYTNIPELSGPGIDTAFLNNGNILNLASSFPVFTPDQIVVLDDTHKGYIYLSCNDSGDTCPYDDADIMYPRPTIDTYVSMSVGSYEEGAVSGGGTTCGTGTNGGLTTQNGGCTCASGYQNYNSGTNSCSPTTPTCQGTPEVDCSQEDPVNCANNSVYPGSGYFCTLNTDDPDAPFCANANGESPSCSNVPEANCNQTNVPGCYWE
jgi:prepilin-type N-terminal cleavage/methylation domain-containing protein